MSTNAVQRAHCISFNFVKFCINTCLVSVVPLVLFLKLSQLPESSSYNKYHLDPNFPLSVRKRSVWWDDVALIELRGCRPWSVFLRQERRSLKSNRPQYLTLYS
jgi:hypothetical protein